MEAAAGVATGHGCSLPFPSSQSSRKEWRAVSDHSARNSGNEDLERTKLGQSDERTICENGTESIDVDFCTITVDENLDNDILRQRLHSVVRQREELQQMEIEIRAQVISGSEIMEMQSSFNGQIKEHANAAIKLQEQLVESERTIHDLEQKMGEKERELCAVNIDNETTWAKEDLLRERSQELAIFHREHDNCEAERAQHLKQIHELKEHFQDKERQFLELEEQHRVAQETIRFKDEQLREAQAWVVHAQEMDTLQSTTNHSLQAELRERTEQYNQLWLGCQRQFADMERHYLHTVQHLQMELAEAREINGVFADDSRVTRAESKAVSPFKQLKGHELYVNEGGALSSNSGILLNGNIDSVAPLVSTGNVSTKVNNVPLVPSSLLGMSTYLPPGSIPTLHPFVLHHQGVQHSVPTADSHVTRSQFGQFQPAAAISSPQDWQTQGDVSEGALLSNHNQYQPPQAEQTLLRSDARFDYELPVNGQTFPSNCHDVDISQQEEPGSVVTATNEEAQLQQNFPELSSMLYDSLRLKPLVQKSEIKDENVIGLTDHSQETEGLRKEQPRSAASESPNHSINFSETSDGNASGMLIREGSKRTVNSTGGGIPELTLLDDRSLLACIVRAIPAGSGGQIRISSTLPNRLGKMLAPLHWHDYGKKYGRLHDIVAGHPELFVIEGDFIQLREGAQKIIAATSAVAKVAAAAASAPQSSSLPAVAVTPMAQVHRLKKVPSLDYHPVKNVSIKHAVGTPTVVSDKPSQHTNGFRYNVTESVPIMKILSKPKDPRELNGLQYEIKESAGGRHEANFVGKQQGRMTSAALSFKRW